MGQIKHGKTPLYYTEGKFKGMPTKQHIILIMHAYSPDKKIYNNWNLYYSNCNFIYYTFTSNTIYIKWLLT